MSKYDGVRKLETNVSESASVEKRKRSGGDLLLRIVFAAVIAAVPLGLKFVPKAEKAVSAVKSAVTYDLVDKEEKDGSEFTFWELIKEYSKTRSGKNR